MVAAFTSNHRTSSVDINTCLYWGAAWHRTKKRACGDRRLCVRIPLMTRFLCAVQRFSLPVYLVYTSLPLRPRLAWLPSCEFEVRGGGDVCTKCTTWRRGRQANQGPYTRLPLGV